MNTQEVLGALQQGEPGLGTVREWVRSLGGVVTVVRSDQAPGQRFLRTLGNSRDVLQELGAAGWRPMNTMSRALGPLSLGSVDGELHGETPRWRRGRGRGVPWPAVEGLVVGEPGELFGWWPKEEDEGAVGREPARAGGWHFLVVRGGAAYTFSRWVGEHPTVPGRVTTAVGYGMLAGSLHPTQERWLFPQGWMRMYPIGEPRSRMWYQAMRHDSGRQVIHILARPKLVLCGVDLAQLPALGGMPEDTAYSLFIRALVKTLARAFNAARNARGDAEEVWQAVSGEPLAAQAEAGSYTLPELVSVPVNAHRIRRAWDNAGSNDLRRAEGNVDRLSRQLREAVQRRKLLQQAAAERRTVEGEVQEALQAGVARAIKLTPSHMEVLLPPLLFKEDQGRVYDGRMYPAGVWRQPDAVASIGYEKAALQTKVFTLEGHPHPHPGVSWGPGDGMLCWGETGFQEENEQRALALLKKGLAPFLEFLWGYLNNVYKDGRPESTAYYPLVCFSRLVERKEEADAVAHS